MLYQCYFYLRYMAGVARWQRKRATDSPNMDSDLPKVSVIVCARNEGTNLSDYLHTLLHQDYPCYEVIVVNDGSEDDTQQVLERYAQQCNNLYITFVPREARVISSKKLALTIGIKAAHYDYLLLTDADCRPESRNWIREMMNGFVRGGEQTEVVLGYGAYMEKQTVLSSLISYDTLFIGLQYMGMAAAGHPYMGVGRNLAYKKSTFFQHDGFRGLLNERSGDDDLFVNKVAAKKAAEEAENVATIEQISIEDFAKIELTTAKIVACEPVKKAKKLLKLTLDDGSENPRTVASGIALYYKPEELIGKNVIVVANLKPAKLCGVESYGMILAADVTEETRDSYPTGKVVKEGTPKEIFSQVELVKSLSLDVPQTSDLMHHLNAYGYSLPTDTITIDECAAQLYKFLEE